MIEARLKARRMGLCLLLAALAASRAGAIDQRAIDGYMTAKMKAARIPGAALAVVRDDRVVYLAGYGRADPSGRPVTPQTSFILGSIAKTITALAVMQLAESGRLELDAPVQRCLPWFHPRDEQASSRITIRHLLTMTSGIPQASSLRTWGWPDQPDALERHARLLERAKASGPPGRSFAYSNPNYILLGAIIQEVSGQRYEQYVEQNIFAPLQMGHSFTSQSQALAQGMATGHRWWFGVPVPETLPFNRANLPAGFLIASAEDMAHFLISQLNGGRYGEAALLSAEGLQRMQELPARGDFGLGWEFDLGEDPPLLNFDGGAANFQASVFLDPRQKVGVFVAANAMSAIDTFSSAAGASPLDGPTARAMAKSVLFLARGQPLPGQGLGHRRVYLFFYALLLSVTLALAAAIARLPARYRRLRRQGIGDRSEYLRRSIRAAALHFVWPLAVLCLVAVPAYSMMFRLYQPDFVLWLNTVAGAVFLKGLWEQIQLRRAYRLGAC